MKPSTYLHTRVCVAVARFFGTFLFAFLALALANTTAALEYESRTLATFVTPMDINDSGWVVGKDNYYSSASGNAILHAGRQRTLVTNAIANGLNNAGEVVGGYTYTDPSNNQTYQHAFRSKPAQSDAIEDLGLLAGGNTAAAYAINASGTAVGSANTLIDGKAVYQAVMFTAGASTPTSLGHLAQAGGTSAYAYDINDQGDIVGAFWKADGKAQPFLRTAGGEIKPLPGFEGLDARAVAINSTINNNGRIIGNVTYADGRQRGFYFENGARTEIESPDGKNTWVHALNDAGHMVGEFECSLTLCSFIVDEGGFKDLTEWIPGKTYSRAFAINNRGDIALYYCPGGSCGAYATVLSPRRQRPVIQYSGLPPRTPAAADGFGSTIALSGDLAVIGAPGENNGAGAAYVYRYSNAQWAEVQRIVAKDSKAYGRFGESVAFDGVTMVVGAPGQDAAYVFQHSGADWTQTAMLPTGSATGSKFGAAVAVNGAGIVVGAPREINSSYYYSGAVYVFDWNGTEWVRTKRIPADLPATEHIQLGTSVQIDGNSVIAGAPGYCGFGCSTSVAYLFQRHSDGWSELKLTPNAPSGAHNFGTQIVVQNDVLAIRSTYNSRVYLYRRGTLAEGVPWVEQDWVSSSDPIAIDGDRLVTVRYENGKYLPQVLRREGRIWVDAFDLPLDNPSAITAVALEGNTLLVGAGSGPGTVAPFSICPAAPCADAPAADIAVQLDAPASARVSELMTHTVTVTNLHPTLAAAYVGTESSLLDSNQSGLTWIGLPDDCRLSLSRRLVSCGVTRLAPGASVKLDLRIPAPAVSGTFTHTVRALHAGPDPAPANNSASATTAIVPSGVPRIDIYAPADGKTIRRQPNQAVELSYEINNFAVGLNGNYFSVSLGGTSTRHDQKAPISLGELQNGKYTVTLALMTKDSQVPVTTNSVTFYVDIATPSVAIEYPRAGEPVACHQGELIAPRVKINHWALGEHGKNLEFQLDGLPLGDPVVNPNAIGSVNLCALGLDTEHQLTAVLRDSLGNTTASSAPMTFELRKALPKVTIRQPLEGGVGYARGGFTLIYDFAPGYDTAQLVITLNNSALAGPFPTTLGTNSVALPAELLRDGANDVLITVTTEGREVQTALVRFTTQVTATPPKSKGGALGLWSLLVLALMRVARRK